MDNSTQAKKLPLCPSARPENSDSFVFGIIGGSVEQPDVQYLQEPQPITEELIELADPVTPTEIFRIAATCITSNCQHFDGQDCKLARRVAIQLPAVTEQLPACAIRRDCRWFQQEGKTACFRCPQVITDYANPSELLEATHDRLRGKAGSWQWAFKTMSHLKEAGIPFGCNTQINRLSAPEFPSIYERIRDAGIFAWQIQLTVPMGNAADNNDILLQPHELLDVYPMIARVAKRAEQEGVKVQPGNNIGYYGPYERLLRGGDAWSFWQGCSAGLSALGIEADGAIKGCPSLPTTAYTGGNIRDHSLRTIVEETEELRFNLGAVTPQGTEHLWGFCKTCEFAELCRGGCSWMAHVFFDKRGNNPYCHHRALTQAEHGIRERVMLERQASGNPFDNGEFVLIEESIDAPLPDNDPLHFNSDRIQWSKEWDLVISSTN